MKSFIKLPANTKGRDFIVADIHGQMDKFMDVLNQWDINPEVDRLFISGDMVDRGAASPEVLKFSKQPWVYPIRGNHENMVIDIVRNYTWTSIQDALLMEESPIQDHLWLQDISYTEAKEWVEYMDSLPYAYYVEDNVHPFYVAHAQLTKPVSFTLMTVDEVDASVSQAYFQKNITWERSQLKRLSKIGEAYLHNEFDMYVGKCEHIGYHLQAFDKQHPLIYVGHSIVPKPVLFNNHYYQDTGSFLEEGYITMTEHKSFAKALLETTFWPKN